MKNGTITCGSAFSVTDTGAVKASNLEITGGSIAIKNASGTTSFEVSNTGVLSATGANISGTITATNSSFSGSITCGAAFGVTNDGAVTASNITITGGEFKIGGTEGSPNFHVDNLGNVKLNGNITWGAGASPTQVLYNASRTASKPTGQYKDFVEGTGGWYKTIGSRKYASYTYDGGNTWGDVIKIIGTDGEDGSDASVTLSNIRAALNLLSSVGDDGIYRTAAGKIGINATAINAGAINIGGTSSKNYADAKFYANVEEDDVQIGGWTVSTTSASTSGGSRTVQCLDSGLVDLGNVGWEDWTGS